MGIYRGPGGTGDADTGAMVTQVAEDSAEAAASATAAASSATAASLSASAAASSASAAAASETAAAGDAAAAASSASAALTSETNASTSETNAADSATAAAGSATSAATSATDAASSATAASSSATAAASSASAASTSATNAASSASEAATSATNAANSASAALTSETNAASSASAASGSASAAATSATNAANSASAAATSATNAASSASASASSATTAQTAETNAAASASAAASSASAADTSADDAASSASAASSSATNAFNSASAASTSATNAANSATAASASASAASASADAALSALDSFDDRYLGQKSVEPTVDNDGNALVTGALYFNTVDNAMKVYDGTQWLNAYASLSGALIANYNLSDLTNVVAARTNLGLGTAATTDSTAYATAAQGALADSAVQPGDLATVATSGSYTDLSNKPTLGTAAATDSTAYATAAQGTKADTAYGWGNHASAGYASDADVVKLTGDQTVAGTKTFSSNPTLSGGTANGVVYLNGSKVVTTGSALTFDGANLGLGVTPSAWWSNDRAYQVVGGSLWAYTGGNDNVNISANHYQNSSNNPTYIGSGYATRYAQSSGQHQWFIAPSGTAGDAISFTQAMTLDASGNLGIGTSSPSYKLHVDGDIYATGNVIANNISGVPAGSIIFHAASSAPTGYLKANGAAVSRSTYSALFSAIGTTFGVGDGSTTFNLPDLRGEFLRGWDDSRGVDSGRSLGSYQSSQNLSHTHSGSAASTSLTGGINARGGSSFPSMDGVFSGSNATTAYNGSYNARTEYTRANFNGTHSHSLSINSDGGGESRPRNIALLACIKY